MKNTQFKKLIKEALTPGFLKESVNEGSNKDYLDFLAKNFTLEKYSITPTRDFHVKATKATFSDEKPMSFKANKPLKSAYRNFAVADILMSEFPGLNEKTALKAIDKWKKNYTQKKESINENRPNYS